MSDTSIPASPDPRPSLPDWSWAWDILIHQSTLLVVIIFLSIWKMWITPVIHSSSSFLKSDTKVDNEVREIMSRMLELTQADRVILCQFHNGEKFSSGGHFTKITATHEVRMPGISAVSSGVQNFPTSRLSQELSLLKNGSMHFFHLDETEDVTCKAVMETRGIQTIYQVLIGNEDSSYGLLILHFCRGKKILSVDQLERINQQTRILKQSLRKESNLSKLFSTVVDKLSP